MEDTMWQTTEGDRDENPVLSLWHPTWTFEVDGSEMGATIDDRCVVFLARGPRNEWGPATHVPAPAIRFVANLLARAG